MKLKNSSALSLAILLFGAWPMKAALQWTNEIGARWAAVTPAPDVGAAGFTILDPAATGIAFTNTLDLWQGEANRVLFNGSGVALGDYDGDSLPDIYLASLNGRNRLYRNLGGWKFEDVTERSGIVCTNRFCRGAAFSDIDGNGALDLLVATTGEGVLAFVNDGQGKFRNATAQAGTASPYGSVTLALADVDGNGTVDLYVANNRTDDIRDRGHIPAQMINGKLVLPPQFTNRLAMIDGKLHEYGEPDMLYLGDGAGRFKPVSWTDGSFLDEDGKPLASPPMDWALTATFRDMNGDGAPDLYVCNDYWSPDRIWINDGRGRFRAISRLAIRCTSASSMGVDFADLTRSGRLDFLVVDMLSRDPALRKRQMLAQMPKESVPGVIENRPQIMRNTLFIDRGDGSYSEAAEFAGLAASEWSWSPMFLDVDLDGLEDVLIATGHVKDVQDLDAAAIIQRQPRSQPKSANPKDRLEAFIQDKIANSRFYPNLETPIVAFRNLGGYKFEEVTGRWGTDLRGVHHSMASADLDGDGDLDLVVNSLGRPAGIYRNNSPSPRVAVRLKGAVPNSQGIGAKIKLLGGAVPMQSHEVIAGGRYMAGSDPVIAFAAAPATPMRIEVVWRNGKVSTAGNVLANRVYEIDEAFAAPAPVPQKAASAPPIFEDASALLAHAHHEDSFDEAARQPLLPRKRGTLGPGVAWADLDGDGWDDLVIGSGRGGRLALFKNRSGALERWEAPALSAPLFGDAAGILATGGGSMLVAMTGYDHGAAGVRRLGLDGPAADLIAGLPSSIGALALADYNADGELDLFVGGNAIPGRYPQAAPSRLYRGNKGAFVLDQSNTLALAHAGLVNSAVFGDLDADGYAELVLACEWGPVRVFKNARGVLTEATAAMGLAGRTGWWTGVSLVDANGDGRIDIVAGNWGQNTIWRASSSHPARLYFGAFSGPASMDLVDAEFDPIAGLEKPRAMRDALVQAIPDLPLRFSNHASYAQASIAQVLGPLANHARTVEAVTLATTLFLNAESGFVAQELPLEAQLAPVFGIACADFDADGWEDIFLGQNFFATRPEVPRHDGGQGVLLLGQLGGTRRVARIAESGLAVHGEARGAAVSDFDRDGRADLVVAQNGAQTKLFRNRLMKRGLRVRLNGPAGNPQGLGAVLRVRSQAGLGPARLVSAGSGWWSQDSAVQVLALPEGATSVYVRWPGGMVVETPVGQGDAELAIVARSDAK